MELERLSFVLILGMLLSGVLLHTFNVRRVHKLVSKLEGRDVERKSLYKELATPQGSIFNMVAMTAWMLLLVAISYFYFFTPNMFSNFNYFQVPKMASSSLGFGVFGLLIAFLVAIAIISSDRIPENYRCYKITELYNFYVISKNKKRAVMLAIPVLWVSIWLSAYQGVRYPNTSEWMIVLPFILLFASLFALLLPIYVEFVEGSR